MSGDLGTWRWDRATGATVWDATLERLFGLEPGTFGGTFEAWVELLHPDDAPAVLATLERAVADRAPYDVEYRVVWPDGSVHWLQDRGMVTVDDDGNVTGTIGSAGDVTARKLLLLAASDRARVAEELVEHERRQRDRFEFLTALNDASRTARGHRQLMRAVAAAAVPRLGDWCAIHFLAEPGSPPEVEVAHADPEKVAWARALLARFPFDPDADYGVARAIRTGRTIYYRDLDRAVLDAVLADGKLPAEALRSALERLHATSAIIVPLRTKQGVVGAVQFFGAESGRHYEEADVALAEAAAGRVAEALDNAWLTEQHQAIAARLQQALLPPRLPQIDGLSVAARYWAAGVANQVGGDFYDIFRAGEHRWAVVIGDVCGTGADAAAVTAIARHTLRAAATHGVAHRGDPGVAERRPLRRRPKPVLHHVVRHGRAEHRRHLALLLHHRRPPAPGPGDGGWRGRHHRPARAPGRSAPDGGGHPVRGHAAARRHARLLHRWRHRPAPATPPRRRRLQRSGGRDGPRPDRRGDDRAAPPGHRPMAPAGRPPRRHGPRGAACARSSG